VAQIKIAPELLFLKSTLKGAVFFRSLQARIAAPFPYALCAPKELAFFGGLKLGCLGQMDWH
tara:strand:- start:1247 stop:1432 length:186 start_codon:yes stop_codon:yes gene_type:complete